MAQTEGWQLCVGGAISSPLKTRNIPCLWRVAKLFDNNAMIVFYIIFRNRIVFV